jgi:hypothetical protein
MEQILLGDLVCLRLPYSRTLRSLVERKVSEWVRDRFDGGYPKGITYKVTLERMQFEPSYRCQVQLCHKEGNWVAEEWGATPDEALRRGLQHMKKSGNDQKLGLKSIVAQSNDHDSPAMCG